MTLAKLKSDIALSYCLFEIIILLFTNNVMKFVQRVKAEEYGFKMSYHSVLKSVTVYVNSYRNILTIVSKNSM